MNFLGIDPGVQGGMALLDRDGVVVEVVQGGDEAETCALLRRLTSGGVRVVVEKVGGYVGPKRRKRVDGTEVEYEGDTGTSMFSFGRNVGVTVGCLLTLGVQFEEVEPQRWQSALGLKRRRGVSKSEWKRQLKARAQELWPEYRVTLWAADALLISRYAMMQSVGVRAATPPADAFEDAWFG